MPNDLRWNWWNSNRNKRRHACSVVSDSMNCSPPSSRSMRFSRARILGVGCHFHLGSPDPGLNPNLWVSWQSRQFPDHCPIWEFPIEIKCNSKCNGLGPSPTLLPPGPGKNCLPWNLVLVPKRLGTADFRCLSPQVVRAPWGQWFYLSLLLQPQGVAPALQTQ